MSTLTRQQLAERIDRNHQVQLANATERLNELAARLGYVWRLVPIKRAKPHGR